MDFATSIMSALNTVNAVAGKCVTYHRGNSWVSLTAVPTEAQHQITNADDILYSWKARDYIVRADELVLDGEAIAPKKGDQIKEIQGEKTYVHEVQIPDGGEQEFRYVDTSRSHLRIHTKLKESFRTL